MKAQTFPSQQRGYIHSMTSSGVGQSKTEVLTRMVPHCGGGEEGGTQVGCVWEND